MKPMEPGGSSTSIQPRDPLRFIAMTNPNEITVLYAGNWISVDEYEQTPEAIAASEASRRSIAEQIEAGGYGIEGH